ncbi:MAG: serine/threonine-protein kinase [Verrucomicrobiaceae bacterium]
MNIERWRHLETLFEEVLEIPAAEREGYINRVCEGDAELRAELKRLLAARSRAEARHLLEQPAWEGRLDAREERSAGGREESEPMIGKVVGDLYLIKQRLGAGGFGEVYLAVGNVAGREAGRFVVKFARHLDEDQRRRFEEEVRINAELKHENIASIHYWGEFEGRQFLVVDYVDGMDLGDYISSHSQPGKGLDLKLIGEITRQVCAGLQYAHDRGVIHRDVKPQNIMIEEAAGRINVKVIDFGLAKSSDGITRRPTEGVIGSFNYLAPEQINPDKFGLPDTRCDVYAMGLVIHEMMTGKIAITTSGIEKHSLFYKQLDYTPPPPGISRAVDQVVMRAIRKLPRERQPTIADLATELSAALKELESPGNGKKVEGRSRSVLVFSLLALLLLGAGGVGRHFLDGGQNRSTVTDSGSPSPTKRDPASPTVLPPASISSPKVAVIVRTGEKGVTEVLSEWNDRVFTSRDQLRLTIEPPGEGYIYLLQLGARNDLTLLYPDQSVPSTADNTVKTNTPVFFPRASRGEPQWFQFDKVPGVEKIYVIYVKDKNARLARLIEDDVARNRNNRNVVRQIMLDEGIEALVRKAISNPIDDVSSVTQISFRHAV